MINASGEKINLCPNDKSKCIKHRLKLKTLKEDYYDPEDYEKCKKCKEKYSK